MRLMTLAELMRLSKIELCDLAAHIKNMLSQLPDGSPKHANAIENLVRIRQVLARRDFSP